MCALRRDEALCRGAFVYAGSRPRRAMRRLRARTPSSCKCSPTPAPRCAWHDIFEPQHITKPGVPLNGPVSRVVAHTFIGISELLLTLRGHHYHYPVLKSK